MNPQQRTLLQTVLVSTSVGIVVGLVLALREVLAQQYVSQHLWRTALWIACRHTLLGALVGSASAVFMLVSLAGWQGRFRPARARSGGPSAEPAAGSAPPFGPRLSTFFAACAAVAVLVMPVAAPDVMGVSYWFPAAACFALFWVMIAASAAETLPDSEHGGLTSRFGLSWSVVIGLGYLVGLAHVWARAWEGWQTTSAAGVGFLAAVGLYRALYRPALLVARRPRAAVRASLGWTPAVALVGAAVLWAVGWVAEIQARARAVDVGTNVIVIAVDTLRWDAVSMLSADEHSRDLTPNLRRLLGPRATVFSNAYTQAPWTLPAFASIFTGLYPEQHGAEHVWSRLGPERTTLAELFREHGYLTMAVVSGHFVTSEVGMAQGFAMYDESLAVGRQVTTSAEVTDKALHFLEAGRDQRFFLFAHYFDPHYPYIRHPEVDLGPARDDELLRLPVGGEARWWGKPAGRALAASREGRLPYNEEVAYTDLHIGRLLAFLDEHQLWDDTYVVFVSDHGEEFFEHGGAGHDHTLYQELVHVPLCLATPSRKLPKVVEKPVETRWLFRTLCEAGGLGRSADGIDGPSLLSRDIQEQRRVRSSTCPRGRNEAEGRRTAPVWLTSLRGERYKAIEDHVRGRAMLFDLVDDPGELRDVGEEGPDMAGELGRALAASDAELLRPEIAGAAPELSEHQLRRLRSLGYL